MRAIPVLAGAAKFAKMRLDARQQRAYVQRHARHLFHQPTGEQRYRVALYFADAMVNAYQIRQWYEPLKHLAESAPVVVITRNAGTALALSEECPLPVYLAPTIGDIEELVDSQNLNVVFYINQNIRNFQMLRFNEPNHVFICHGESEKAYMWSNQLKAYDYVFSAGQAARDRLALNLRNYDVEQRTRLVGRPQIDAEYLAPYALNSALPTVLYAPTWEGDRPSMNYGSVSSHGVQVIDSLINDGGFNVIFRPHPRSGVNVEQFGADVAKIRERLNSANPKSAGRLLFDDTAHWGWQWHKADACITDISAVAYDFFATGKPIFITTPVSSEAVVADSPALEQLPSLSSVQAAHTADLVREALETNDAERDALIEKYFGDITPGASMTRFLAESLALLDS
ncbi:CDP-glycerol--glycerophosphate glycerophosphotransferase [Arthrobacter sp. MYb229]|uniref:CDP-glycerol glycerophosphotransferase family protein n=1 Tax=Micrococcaceae TaxID=1268 RepID=UPI000CFD9B3C|nr:MULTISPECIES: CDP-glycerol glycerophosphotransferase family protein [unclassified Arthrobacter]PRA06950.1 CDP-glycerol--glycerophosphate glycerophosphotransferase [Arthrobacter sp. MYb229]PRB47898.1 CDP-glycerol--glycerophosphate glycerophosphotransferase [Arthrobacter sp. MYb216]